MEKSGAEDGVPAELPRVPISKMVSEMASQVGGHLSLAPVFVKDGRAVIVDDVNHRIEPLSAVTFRAWVEDYLVFYKWVGGENGRDVEQSVTAETAAAILAAPQFLCRLRPLRKRNPVALPVIRPGGDLELLPAGYDARTGIWTGGGVVFERDWGLEQSVEFLKDLLKEFPFAGDDRWSECVQIAAMLAMFVTDMLPRYAHRPMLVFNANQSRSGKTLLAKLAICGVAGSLALTSMPATPDKRKEMLNTFARNAKTFLFADNLEGTVNFPELCAYVTAAEWTDRRMHAQEDFTAENVTNIFLTGNGFTPGDDVMNRSLSVDLYVEEADPQAREVRNIIDDSWCLAAENRALILSALWGLTRHWDECGRPRGGCRLADFAAWSDIVGGIVKCAGDAWGASKMGRKGWGDPIERRTTASGGNKEIADFVSLLGYLAEMGDQENLFDVDGRMKLKFPQVVRVVKAMGLFANKMQPFDESGAEDFQLGDVEGAEMAVELDGRERSWFGKLLTKRTGGNEVMGSVYTLADGKQRVRVMHQGKGRHRRLVLERVEG